MSNYAAFFTGQKDAADPAAVAEKPRYRILFVDDEPAILKALTRIFRSQSYEVLTAGNSTEALARLKEAPVQVIISDYMMPGMNGAELLKHVKKLYPDTIRIMLTGHADTGAVMGAINEGAVYKFILKPWNDDDLRVTVSLALEQFDLVQKNRALTAENAKKSKEISALSRMAVSNRSQLGTMLHKKGLITSAQWQELTRLQGIHKEPLIKLLLERGWVAEKALRKILREDLLVEEVSLGEFRVDSAIAELIPRSFCRKQWVVPLKLEGRRLMLALADPMDAGLIDDIRFTAGLDLKVVMADSEAIQSKIAEVYGSDDGSDIRELETLVGNIDPYEGIEIVIDDDEAVPLDELMAATNEPPAIRLVNAIILEAIRLGASDIHIQPKTKNVVVRLRIDGVLQDKIQIPHALHSPLVSRLKIMAELDISERRRPQDGRITVKSPLRIVDLRISTLPTINGEKVVMRILDRNSQVLSLAGLGFGEAGLAKVRVMVDKPQGLVLATGPTGSGKTTTLYSLLQANASPAKNYITIEDPVEYYLDSAGQVLVKEKIGLTFPAVLRAILRQDPDVVLIGEIRDYETAEVAFHTALTGHQVLSTLHTNSALATIARLLDLGLKPFIVASALEGVIAQRLVRRICRHCRREAVPDSALAARLGSRFAELDRVFAGEGCAQCDGTGYHGRLGLYEILLPDEHLRDLITRGASIREITAHARASGHETLWDDALMKIARGDTTLEEILRVLGPEPE
ncbi:ATPase, T2SS/T4P/T4SS family [Aromatoleum petrolei]|uniref:Response regulator n=1 Tax=Aromatoleum petrolei TaxID=76116 RepID=A0ABX1MJV3_9RHOO|nr:ATPase, T2SS/T4P/T4SS family [Aromatoleum petrolei]NMF86923.1 response regulator [Aromatoleum petrolei]QTQ37516.1 putative type II secretion system protein E [Aromatoleum petrolei]